MQSVSDRCSEHLLAPLVAPTACLIVCPAATLSMDSKVCLLACFQSRRRSQLTCTECAAALLPGH